MFFQYLKLLSDLAKKSLTSWVNQWSSRIHLHWFTFILLVNQHSWNYTRGTGGWTFISTPQYKHTCTHTHVQFTFLPYHQQSSLSLFRYTLYRPYWWMVRPGIFCCYWTMLQWITYESPVNAFVISTVIANCCLWKVSSVATPTSNIWEWLFFHTLSKIACCQVLCILLYHSC